MRPSVNLNWLATRLKTRRILSKYLEPLRELGSLDKKLRIAFIALATYLITRLLADLPVTLYFLLEYQDFYNLEGFSTFRNFLLLITLIAIYLILLNHQNRAPEEREKILARSLASIFALYYILHFRIVQEVIELRLINASLLPSDFQDLLPIDWYSIQWGIEDMLEGIYFKYDDFLELLLATISAISLAIALCSFILFLKSKWHDLNFKLDLLEISREFRATKSKIVVIALILPFLIIGNDRIQADDYSTLTFEVQFMQEELVEFQGKLPKNSELISQTELYDARKFNAQYAYKDFIKREKRITDPITSIWSPEVKELRVEVIEWLELWRVVLQDLSLNGFTSKESLFKLEQKYKEISSLAVAAAPRFTQDYDVDFWRDDFVELLSY